MTNTLKSILTAGAIGLANILPMKNVEAQGNVRGSLEFIQSEIGENSYPRLNSFYRLPQRISGYTFMEFYKNGDGYFGRTNLNRPIINGVGPRTIMIHGGEPVSKVGLGIGAIMPHMPRNISATAGVIPFWIDKDGRRIRNNIEFQYSINANLPLGLSVNSFGIWNVAAQNGPQWRYGEVNAGRNFGKFRISYNPALLNDGDAYPKVEHRAAIELKF